MNRIHIMDEHLSNKIAAGEVVERPSSIVKELVENSIDAGSTAIEVSLEEAGLQSIRVTDNGMGMSKEDAVRAFERHATSKISNEHDLFRIRTLGFRGEALASIAAVSKVSLWTSDGETEGTFVEIEGGKIIKYENGALRKGTDLSIRQLFYNTPARLKYMKTIQTELGHTTDLINRLALSNPHIAFTLVHEQHQILQTAGNGDQLRVLANIYGSAMARKMISFEGANADFQVSGFVTLPEVTRASKNYVTLIVNGRWVKSFAVTEALLDAMHTYLPIGRYPVAVINVTADPILTDVNVHPAKRHIRMSKEGEAISLIKQAVQQALKKAVVIPDAVTKEKRPSVVSEQTSIWNELRNSPPQQQETVYEQRTPAPARQAVIEPPIEEVIEEHESVEELWSPPPVPVERETSFETPPTEELEEEVAHFPDIVPIGQIHGTYIAAQNEDGFYLIDQHAAQERIKYEFFKKKLGEAEANERQQLLIPLMFHYSADERIRIEERLDALKQVGIFLEPFGPSTYTVKEYPAWFPEGQASALIEEMIEEILNERTIDIEKIREESAILMSCKRSIKANHYLTMADMERLLEDLSKADNPYTCPHGRPVLIHFTTYELEKMFKRVM